MRISFVLVALSVSLTVAAQTPGFRIVVIQGEDAVNVIQQKTAVNPVVEVRDRNDVPVAGVTVIFTVGGQGATFAGGASMLTVTTNAIGQAVVTGLTPTATGAVTISANAVVQGQVMVATITQTNFATHAAAAAAAAGGGAGSASAPATTGAAGGGGGVSGQTLAIFGGVVGAAGAGALALAGGKAEPPPNQPPTLAAVQPSPAIGLQSATSIAFTAQTNDPNGDSLTFQWAFGDGGTSTAAAPSYVYNTSGTFTVRLTVSDGSATATGETSVTIRNVTGRWVGIWRSDTGGDTAVTIDAVQNGTSVIGSSIVQAVNRQPFNCAITGGSVSAPKFVVFANDSPCAAFGGTTFAQWRGILDDSLNRVDHTFSNGPFFLVRQ